VEAVFSVPCYKKSDRINCVNYRGVGRDSVVGIATGWTVRGSNPAGGEIFRNHPDRPWGPPSLLYNGYRVSFPGVKQRRRGVDHLTISSAEVTKKEDLYLYFPLGLHGLF
jgi:hypothetical protein